MPLGYFIYKEDMLSFSDLVVPEPSVISIVIFILFLFYASKRLSNPNDYDSLMSMQTIIEDIVLTCGVGLITISYILTEKGISKILELGGKR